MPSSISVTVTMLPESPLSWRTLFLFAAVMASNDPVPEANGVGSVVAESGGIGTKKKAGSVVKGSVIGERLAVGSQRSSDSDSHPAVALPEMLKIERYVVPDVLDDQLVPWMVSDPLYTNAYKVAPFSIQTVPVMYGRNSSVAFSGTEFPVEDDIVRDPSTCTTTGIVCVTISSGKSTRAVLKL